MLQKKKFYETKTNQINENRRCGNNEYLKENQIKWKERKE